MGRRGKMFFYQTQIKPWFWLMENILSTVFFKTCINDLAQSLAWAPAKHFLIFVQISFFYIQNREAKFKRAFRVHFLTHFTKNFCRFLTPRVKSGTDMINPSIESSDFLFWHEKIKSRIFENFVGNRQSNISRVQIWCVYRHPKFQNMKFSLSVFDKIFKNQIRKFFHAKIENQSFRLMGWSYLCHF